MNESILRMITSNSQTLNEQNNNIINNQNNRPIIINFQVGGSLFNWLPNINFTFGVNNNNPNLRAR